MQKVKVVTAYSPLPVLNVSQDRFQELGRRLIDAVGCPIHVFNYWPVERCMFYKKCRNGGIRPSAHRVPEDRFPSPWIMALSNIVQCEKPSWVYRAWCDDDESDVFVWIDFGIFKQQGITAEIVRDFIVKIEDGEHDNKITAPGLIDPGIIDMGFHCTRFCGSVVIVPRDLVSVYQKYMNSMVVEHIEQSRTISWDVNYLACCEQDEVLPFRQYKAWWDQTQFTNYQG